MTAQTRAFATHSATEPLGFFSVTRREAAMDPVSRQGPDKGYLGEPVSSFFTMAV